MAESIPDTMPRVGDGWVLVEAGKHLVVLFHPNRRLAGRDDGIVRPSIVVGVPGKDEQALRFDPFRANEAPAHVHAGPTQTNAPIPSPADTPILLVVKDGQSDLDAALEYFEEPDCFRVLLLQAGVPEIAAQVSDEDLAGAARQIRQICAA